MYDDDENAVYCPVCGLKMERGRERVSVGMERQYEYVCECGYREVNF